MDQEKIGGPRGDQASQQTLEGAPEAESAVRASFVGGAWGTTNRSAAGEIAAPNAAA
jgi:hypothetical protein